VTSTGWPLMDEQELDAIKRRAAQSQQQLNTVRSLLTKNGAPSLRSDFARCAIDLACEHHSAIIRLVLAGEYGSAGALLRPLLEASTTASWLLYAATCDYIRSLPTSATAGRAPDIPQLDRMLDQLQPWFPDITKLLLALKNKGPAVWLHQYTHGGTPQLLRRSSGWNGGAIHYTLMMGDLFGILAAAHETVIVPNADLSEYVFPRRDELGVEAWAIMQKTDPPPKPPHSLPPIPSTACDGCGPPMGA